MYMKKAKMDNKKLIIGIILTTLVLVIGTSYAFFTLTLRGEKDLTVISGTLALQYKDQNVINLEKAYPISDQEGMNLVPYEFSVENTGDIRALYDIILEENEENNLNAIWLKYSIKRNEEEWSTPRKISSLKLEEGLEVDPGETDTFQLRLWIDENVGNEAQNKSFKARVVINSTQSNASTSDLTPPVITLNGSLSENVEQGEIYTDPGVASVSDDHDTLEISEVKVSYKYFDGESTTNVEEIDTSKIGVYYIYYKLKDTKGNEGRIIRSVNVYQKNTSVPIIKLNGKSMITIEKGKSYTELGATARKDGEDLTSKIVITGEVNVNQAGVYEIRYVVRDDDGNTASIVRVVNVVYVKEGQSNEITIDLSDHPSEKVTLEGENLGEVTYTSSDESIASVDVDGTVTGVTPGEVTVHITTSTGVTKEVHVKVVKTVSVSYVKQGSAITSIGKESDSCTITSKGGSCEVNLPTITVRDGYTAVGWSKNRDVTTGEKAGSKITLNQEETYYTISYQNEKTYMVTYTKQGAGVSSIGKTSDSCTIAKAYNGATQATTCEVTAPSINVSTGYTAVGWNTNKEATSGTAPNAKITLSSDATYFSISYKNAITYTVNFNANGNTVATTSKSCTIDKAYNTASQGTSCSVTTPVITAPSATPTVVGYNQDKTAKTSEVGSNVSLTVTSSINGKTYYAITKKASITRSVSYTKGAGVSSIGKTSDSCTIGETYNNTAQGTSCSVSLPTITSSAGYNTGFWSTSNTATSGTSAGTSISLSGNATYYARALDTTKPVWSLVSTSPASGTISSGESLVITFKGTDTSGSVTSTLVAGNITVKSGSTTVSPSTKTLSSASNVTNGKQYSLTLSGIHTEGVISITIAASTLKDGSNNANDITTFTTGVTMKNTASDTLLNKANPTTLTYDNASDAQKKEMFTFTHEAGEQQSGWSASELIDYRYVGYNPNNYVTFNGETWRIIGVFTVEDENGKKEKRMKLIRNDFIGQYSWDNKQTGEGSSLGLGSNEWGDSRLKDVLNSGPYYNRSSGSCPYGSSGSTTACDFSSNGLTMDAKNMIGKAKWYLGGHKNGVTPIESYEYERGTNVPSGYSTNWVGEVGLMYSSDYGYAAGLSKCLNTKLQVYKDSCYSYVWLKNYSVIQWTITKWNTSSYNTGIDIIDTDGQVHPYTNISSVYEKYWVRPSVYLKSSVSISSGDGSSSNPYTLLIN